MARLTGAEVSVLHVVASAASFAAVVPLEEDTEAKAVLDEAVTTLRDGGIHAEGAVVNALTTRTAATISSAAEEFQADLLVLSPHRHGLFAALFNPRVSDAVVHHSSIAVLLTPGDGEGERR